MAANVKQRSIEQINLEVLKPAPGNPRKHPKKQLKALIKSIESVGWTVPILVDEDDAILAGHGRFQAAKLMGLQTVPCIRLSGLSSEQKRAYRIADNKLALDAIWDMELLAANFQILEGAGFDLNLTGFGLPEIDAIRAAADEAATKPSRPEDDCPELPKPGEVVTKPGHIWLMGRHRLLCGDAKDPQSVETLLTGDKVDLVFTDPPYNVPVQGHVSGLG